MRSGDGFVLCSDGQPRWGLFGAAGVVLVWPRDGDELPLVMLQLRSGWSHEGGTWSCPGCDTAIDSRQTDLITDHLRDCDAADRSAGRPA